MIIKPFGSGLFLVSVFLPQNNVELNEYVHNYLNRDTITCIWLISCITFTYYVYILTVLTLRVWTIWCFLMVRITFDIGLWNVAVIPLWNIYVQSQQTHNTSQLQYDMCHDVCSGKGKNYHPHITLFRISVNARIILVKFHIIIILAEIFEDNQFWVLI